MQLGSLTDSFARAPSCSAAADARRQPSALVWEDGSDDGDDAVPLVVTAPLSRPNGLAGRSADDGDDDDDRRSSNDAPATTTPPSGVLREFVPTTNANGDAAALVTDESLPFTADGVVTVSSTEPEWSQPFFDEFVKDACLMPVIGKKMCRCLSLRAQRIVVLLVTVGLIIFSTIEPAGEISDAAEIYEEVRFERVPGVADCRVRATYTLPIILGSVGFSANGTVGSPTLAAPSSPQRNRTVTVCTGAGFVAPGDKKKRRDIEARGSEDGAPLCPAALCQWIGNTTDDDEIRQGAWEYDAATLVTLYVVCCYSCAGFASLLISTQLVGVHLHSSMLLNLLCYGVVEERVKRGFRRRVLHFGALLVFLLQIGCFVGLYFLAASVEGRGQHRVAPCDADVVETYAGGSVPLPGTAAWPATDSRAPTLANNVTLDDLSFEAVFAGVIKLEDRSDVWGWVRFVFKVCTPLLILGKLLWDSVEQSKNPYSVLGEDPHCTLSVLQRARPLLPTIREQHFWSLREKQGWDVMFPGEAHADVVAKWYTTARRLTDEEVYHGHGPAVRKGSAAHELTTQFIPVGVGVPLSFRLKASKKASP